MKNIFVISLILVQLSCSVQDNKYEYVINKDNAIVYFKPTVVQLDSLRKTYENEEDFYISADDANYYWYLANQYLEKHHIKYDTTTMYKFIYLQNEKQKLSFPKEMGFGGFFIYEKGKYKDFSYSVDIGLEWKVRDGKLEKQ
jgi:hypothetical protein